VPEQFRTGDRHPEAVAVPLGVGQQRSADDRMQYSHMIAETQPHPPGAASPGRVVCPSKGERFPETSPNARFFPRRRRRSSRAAWHGLQP